jgi:nucleotide-binding universal stress UspA family protein
MVGGSGRTADLAPTCTDAIDVAADAGRIVVGIDGSTGSAAALHWAAEEAQLRGVEVHAVMAWQQPAVYGTSSLTALGMDPSMDTKLALAAAAEAEVARLGAKVAEGSDVVIVCEALEGHPAETLVHAAEGAALLVVGTRGHGGFVGALLGSVSQHVVAHAACPVVVVTDPSCRRAVDMDGAS